MSGRHTNLSILSTSRRVRAWERVGARVPQRGFERTILAIALVSGALACGHKTDPPTTPGSPRAASLTLVAGDRQSGTVDTPLRDSLVVRVDDEKGLPLPGAVVSWRVTMGGGAVSGATATTNSHGRAGVILTLGRFVGPDSVVAELSGSAIQAVKFGASAAAGPVSSVIVLPATLNLLVRESASLRTDLRDVYGNTIPSGGELWSSDAPSVATVSPAGVVSALTPGTANISANTLGKIGSARVTVSPPPVARVRIAPVGATLQVGRSTQLTAVASDDVGDSIPSALIAWASINPTVATVSSTGLVSAQSPGRATVTAMSQGKGDTAYVDVTPGPVTQVQVQSSRTTLLVSDTLHLRAVARDSAGNVVPGRSPAWLSSSPTVATVTPAGLVTGVSRGAAAIRATIDGVQGSLSLTIITETVGVYSETPPLFLPNVDTFFGTFVGLGAVLSGFRDDSSTKAEGAVSLRATIQSSGNGFAGWFVAWGDATRYGSDGYTRDMSKYRNGSIRFWVRSPVDLEVGIRSGNVAAGAEASKTRLSLLGVSPGAAWKPVCVPIAPLAGESPLADLGRVKILFVVSVNQTTGGTGGISVTFWIDDIRWDVGAC